VFGLYQARDAIQALDRCVLVEGNFDVVSLHARGIRNITAPLGTAFTSEQATEIKRFTANVTLLFDGDKAGIRATRSARAPCQEVGLNVRVATLPDGLDPDDLVRRDGKEGMQGCINGARGMLEYLIESVLDRGFSAHDAQTQAAKIKEVTELIASEDDPTVRALAEKHADALAQRFGPGDVNTLRTLRQAVSRASRPSNDQPRVARVAAPPERARSRARGSDIAKEVLGALLEYPELFTDAEIVEHLSRVEGPLALAIASWRASVAGNLATQEAIERFPEAYRAYVSRRLAAPLLDTAEIGRQVLLANLIRLFRLYDKEQGRSAVDDLREAGARGDEETQMNLLRERLAHARRKHGLV
jgi:DNA primase